MLLLTSLSRSKWIIETWLKKDMRSNLCRKTVLALVTLLFVQEIYSCSFFSSHFHFPHSAVFVSVRLCALLYLNKRRMNASRKQLNINLRQHWNGFICGDRCTKLLCHISNIQLTWFAFLFPSGEWRHWWRVRWCHSFSAASAKLSEINISRAQAK